MKHVNEGARQLLVSCSPQLLSYSQKEHCVKHSLHFVIFLLFSDAATYKLEALTDSAYSEYEPDVE